jgi:hypothetical protein
MKRRAWERLALDAIASLLSHPTSIRAGRLVREPVGPVLLSYAMDSSAFSSEDFYVNVSAVGLFAPQDPREVLGLVERVGGGWTTLQGDELGRACLERGEPFLDSCATLDGYAAHLLPTSGSPIDPNNGERLAAAYVLLGRTAEAASVAREVVDRWSTNEHDWVQELVQRVQAFSAALDADGSEAVKAQLERQIAANKALLGIAP